MHNTFDLYGMGNALVDAEFTLSDKALEALGIEKGVMTLVEHEEMTRLLKALEHLHCTRASGGSAANTIMTAQILGNQTYYSCKVANDPQGDLFLTQFTEQGVSTNLNETNREDGSTGTCIVKITPDAERTMCTYLGITSEYSEREMDFDALNHSKCLYIEGYFAAQPNATKAAIKAKQIAEKSNIKTSITLSDPNIVKFFKENLLAIIGTGVDLIFCNEHEAMMLCDTDDLDVAKEQLKKYTKTYAITLGSKGACIFDGKQSMTVPGENVDVINTVGAGDIFAGAFLYALSKGNDYTKATKLANIAAGQVVTKVGGRINQADAKLILAQFNAIAS